MNCTSQSWRRACSAVAMLGSPGAGPGWVNTQGVTAAGPEQKHRRDSTVKTDATISAETSQRTARTKGPVQGSSQHLAPGQPPSPKPPSGHQEDEGLPLQSATTWGRNRPPKGEAASVDVYPGALILTEINRGAARFAPAPPPRPRPGKWRLVRRSQEKIKGTDLSVLRNPVC